MAVKAINDTAGPDGITPTLLVFGTYPRIMSDQPHPSIAQRAAAIRKAMDEVCTLQAKHQVNNALCMRNGLMISVRDALIGADVLVWQENKGWKGLYALLEIQGDICTIQLTSSPTEFRITSVKHFYNNADDQNTTQALDANQQDDAIQDKDDNQVPRVDDQDNSDSNIQEQAQEQVQEQQRTAPSRQCKLPTRFRDEVYTYLS
jgi:hypothetical protein